MMNQTLSRWRSLWQALCLLALFGSATAHATCTRTQGQLSTYVFTQNQTKIFNPSRNPSVPMRLGDIGGADPVASSPEWTIHCNGGEGSGWHNQAGDAQPVMSSPDKGPIYPISSLPGIGYTVSDTPLFNQSPNYFAAYPSVSAHAGDLGFNPSNYKVRIDFWLWGSQQLKGGEYCFPSGTTLGSLSIGGVDALHLQMQGTLCIQVKVPTCHLQTRDIQVDMGRVMAGSIQPRSGPNGQGNTDPGHDFQIVLDQCDQVSSAKLSFSADNSGALAFIPGMAQLIQTSQTARGVAIQLLDGNRQAVTFNNPQTYAVHGNRLEIPYKVRYISTSRREDITSGRADAVMHFTVEYP